MKKRLAWVLLGLILAAALGLVLLALSKPHPGNFAHTWYWSNDGVGNFTDDTLLIILIGWIGKQLLWPHLINANRKLHELHTSHLEERKKNDEHRQWTAQVLSALHEAHVGPAPAHPHYPTGVKPKDDNRPRRPSSNTRRRRKPNPAS